MEELCKAVYLMCVFQAIKVVQHQTQFFITVFRQRIAALSGGRSIIDVTAQSHILRKDDTLAIEEKASHSSVRHKDVRQRLKRNEVKSILPDKIDAII